jgi:membrane protein CcdC involved in cytochrome C biogenesis
MAKAVRKKEGKRKAFKDDHLPLAKENFVIIGVGLIVILAGYIAMLEGSVEGFLPLVLAPILLILGYCVIVPLGILYRKSYIKAESSPQDQPIKESKAG